MVQICNSEIYEIMDVDMRNEVARKRRRQRLMSTSTSATEDSGLREHFGWTVLTKERVSDGTFPHLTVCSEHLGERVRDEPVVSEEVGDRISTPENEEEDQPRTKEPPEEQHQSVTSTPSQEEPVVPTLLNRKPTENRKRLIHKFFYRDSNYVKRSEIRKIESETSVSQYKLRTAPVECLDEGHKGDGNDHALNITECEEDKKRTEDVEERKVRGFSRWALCLGSEVDGIFLDNRRRSVKDRLASEPRAGSKLISRFKYNPQKYGRGEVSEKLMTSSEHSVPNKYLFVASRNKEST
ncbi:hypothetical protein J6590_042037 [Homalodisca vitripennis]|nr:hypothetical protein J6590_042037 [Homalodisca vitripennis]